VGGSIGWPGLAHWADTEHAHELRAMSWDSLRTLAASGWEIGSHTRSHPHLPRLNFHGILAELQESRVICEQMLGAVCRSVAYPFGEADGRVRAAAEAAGYEAAAGLSEAAFLGRDRFDWPRVGVWHGEPGWRFDLKVLPVTSSLRGTRGGARLLDLARNLMRAERSVVPQRGRDELPVPGGSRPDAGPTHERERVASPAGDFGQ
jgi:peptidoglycan/xylan/chitin deacetylase (PgdA/CDA1 family)